MTSKIPAAFQHYGNGGYEFCYKYSTVTSKIPAAFQRSMDCMNRKLSMEYRDIKDSCRLSTKSEISCIIKEKMYRDIKDSCRLSTKNGTTQENNQQDKPYRDIKDSCRLSTGRNDNA